MRIFAEKNFDEIFQCNSNALKSEIELQEDNYLLNVNETEFIDYLFDKYSVGDIIVKFSEVFASYSERYIPSEDFPRDFDVQTGKEYKKTVVKYHIPFQGDSELLRCCPNSFNPVSIYVTIEENCICFEIINFRDNPKEIKQRADTTIKSINQQLDNVRLKIERYNSHLRNIAQQAFQFRKQQLLKTMEVISNIGVPLKKRENIPSTFAVPSSKVSRRNIGYSKPSVIQTGSKLEPSLDESAYQDILQIIHDIGKQYERMPSTYTNKHEEDIRDLFLLFLESHFVGSATGETFNKSGKTDILLKYQGENVFIAECKFWKGEKGFLETISQLFGYLTWRDSKAAVILFVRNKSFSTVVDQVELSCPKHQNYVKLIDKKESTWFNLCFHLPGDINRKIKLAILIFHFPKI